MKTSLRFASEMKIEHKTVYLLFVRNPPQKNGND